MNKISKPLVIVGALVLVLIITIVSFLGYFSNVKNEGLKHETNLSALDKVNIGELSNLTLKAQETLGIAEKGNEQIGAILSDAIAGRYGNDVNQGTDGKLFSAITEAYPDLTKNTAMYEKVMDVIIVGRDKFQNQQTIMADKVSAYNYWRNEGLIRPMVVKMLGIPSENLKAVRGGETFTGLDALKKMDQVIASKEATKAFETGELEPIITPSK